MVIVMITYKNIAGWGVNDTGQFIISGGANNRHTTRMENDKTASIVFASLHYTVDEPGTSGSRV